MTTYSTRNRYVIRVVEHSPADDDTATWFVGPIEGNGDAQHQARRLETSKRDGARECYIEPLYEVDRPGVTR